MPELDTSPSTSDEFFIPGEKAAPKGDSPPAHLPKIKNLAGDEDLCKKVWGVAQRTFKRYAEQTARDDLEDSLKEADQMYRLSPQRPNGRNKMKTVSNVRESAFLEKVESIHANEMSVLQEDELPAKYDINEQSIGVEFIDEDEARAAANARQSLEQYTWEADDRKEKVANVNWRNQKYGNAIVSVQWDRQVERRKVRVVTSRDEDGIPKGFTFETKDIVVKDCPTFGDHDFKNVWFDMTLDEIEQSSVIEHAPKMIQDIYAEQRQYDGKIMNAGKIKRRHMYTHEPAETEIKDDRHLSADEDIPEDMPNGTIDIWHAWMRLPINEKGKWDEKNTLAEMFWCTFAGPIDSGNSICLRIIRKPYNHGNHPYRIIHSNRDDKGVIHDGLAEKLKYLHWEAQTNLAQAIDNKDLRNRSPFVIQGQVISGDLKFQSQNKAIKVAFGTTITKMDIPDSTQITMQMDDRIQQKIDRVALTSKPFLGEGIGGGASATESKNVFDQAIKPSLAKVNYFAEQLFPWMFRMDALLWEQFGDPKRQLRIQGALLDPSKIWGPFNVKVSVITEYAANALVRQQIGAFLSQNYAQAAPEMTPEGRKMLWQQVWKIMGLENGKLIFGMPDVGDSLALAREESYKILDGIQQVVTPDQNHLVHLEVHKSILKEAELAIKVEEHPVVEANLPLLKAHILQHEQAQQQANQAQQPQQPQGGEQIEGSGLVGNVTGNGIEAQEGAIAAAG